MITEAMKDVQQKLSDGEKIIKDLSEKRAEEKAAAEFARRIHAAEANIKKWEN